jgi:hypothetical protein
MTTEVKAIAKNGKLFEKHGQEVTNGTGTPFAGS